MSSEFDRAAVASAIGGTRFAGLLWHYRSIDSTSTQALAAAQAGLPGGVWVADEQTAGRGRGGHSWHSIAGDGLYVSALLRPQLAPARALWISLATGLAAHAAILETTGLAADIRWPNDLILHGKKCGGILVETGLMAGDPTALRYAVIGIGINVNHANFPPELDALATSLRREAGQPQRREPLLTALLRHLDHELTQLVTGSEDILTRFAAVSTWVHGRRVHVAEDGGYTGTTAGLDADGFLTVHCDDGSRRTVRSGGVRELA